MSTSSQTEADEFFARYTNPTPETIERLRQEAHPDGDIDAIVEEADHYWDRVTTARTQRARDVTNTDDPFAHRDERARRPYATPEALAMLPTPAHGARPLADRYADAIQAHRFWARIAKPENAERVAGKAREARDRAQHVQDRAEKAAARRASIDRRNAQLAARRQAHLERTLQRIGHIHAAREAADLRHRTHRLRTEIHPAGMTLDRALEIALAATPPQKPR